MISNTDTNRLYQIYEIGEIIYKIILNGNRS